jgi:hypothetical protein
MNTSDPFPILMQFEPAFKQGRCTGVAKPFKFKGVAKKYLFFSMDGNTKIVPLCWTLVLCLM